MFLNNLLWKTYYKLTNHKNLHNILHASTNNAYYVQTLPNVYHYDDYYYGESKYWLLAKGGINPNPNFIFSGNITSLLNDYLTVLVNYLCKSSGVGFQWSQARIETLPDFYWLLYTKRV